MNKDKCNSGHSKISRIEIKREKDLILDEDEWMRVSEEMQKMIYYQVRLKN